MQLANIKQHSEQMCQLMLLGYERKHSPWWMDTFVFLCSMFHRLLLPMFSSSRTICWTGGKITPKQADMELGVGGATLTVEINLAHKVWLLSAVGNSPSVLSWRSPLWQKQQRNMSKDALQGKHFWSKMLKKGLSYSLYVLILYFLWRSSREWGLFTSQFPQDMD